MSIATRTIRTILKSFDIGIARYSTLEKLWAQSTSMQDLELLTTMPNAHASRLLQYLPESRSQLRQDLFVLSRSEFRRNGYFVEFGATNGIDLSNTYLLEKDFGWSGILAEPALRWQEDLRRNRSAAIESNCVWTDTGSTLTFNEVEVAEFSTIDRYSSSGLDLHRKTRQQGRTYQVNTISLNDLLSKHKAPRLIDYLSIDTEGSEFEILNSFDFSSHSFRVVTVEHNFTPERQKIFDLLTRHGYTRQFESLSKFDDWYVKGE